MLIPMVALTISSYALEIESVEVSVPIIEENPTNYSPVAENLNFTTYKGVSVHGRFAAIDPEGDLLTYRIVTQPKKGEVAVQDIIFVYTPDKNKKGKDSFTYVALDSNGNVSQEATVSIVVEKQSTKITYADMSGTPDEYAALRLAEDGVFIGEKVGSEYYFNANRTVTRGEFLAMCVSLTGMEPITDVSRTGFDDDALMPTWVKPFVSAALMKGMISGYRTDGGASVFAPNMPISIAEAAVMLNNALEISNVRSASYFDESGVVPTWASQAAANLSACNIIGDISISSSEPLSRAAAADMLAPAAMLLQSREDGKSLLSWAF
jgi:hypothetical protein